MAVTKKRITSSEKVKRTRSKPVTTTTTTTTAKALATTQSAPSPTELDPAMPTPGVPASLQPQLQLITSSSRTAFEKRVWTALLQIPSGHYTTYGLLSQHLGSSPRAVGNALRRNPFAPEVPCHRVVATGGTLGGFKGKWPRDGEGITLDEKRKLLRGEGIRFDEKGRVLGTPWVAFPKE